MPTGITRTTSAVARALGDLPWRRPVAVYRLRTCDEASRGGAMTGLLPPAGIAPSTDDQGEFRRATSHAASGFDVAMSRANPTALPSITLQQMISAGDSAADADTNVLGNATRMQSVRRHNLGDISTMREASADMEVLPAALRADPWGTALDSQSRPTATGAGAAIIHAGERYLGVPYQWGGTDPATGFDCSGFVQQVFADLGVRMPRVSIDQSRVGTRLNGIDQAQPGDLLFWRGTGSRPNHIGIYAGDGTMLVAPRTGDVVRYQQVTRTPDVVTRVVT